MDCLRARLTAWSRHFFFPGFTPAPGGLLLEDSLLPRRDQWLADPSARWRRAEASALTADQRQRVRNGARQVMLFCYPQAPAQALVDCLKRQAEPSILIVPQGVCPTIAGQGNGHLYIHDMPFVDQTRFDELLWSSDLNLVRGEDSLVRALWAAKPLIWQIYPQAEQAHLDKQIGRAHV